MLTCFDVAKYFLSLTDEEAEDAISNLKLQKLVYYAQGFHLAIHDAPLFNEKIVAWMHGPVIEELYRHYKEHGSLSIPKVTDLDIERYPPEVKELLDEVYSVYGQYSAWKLRDMTHEELPWVDAFQDGKKRNPEIKHQSMSSYFKTMLVTHDGQEQEEQQEQGQYTPTN